MLTFACAPADAAAQAMSAVVATSVASPANLLIDMITLPFRRFCPSWRGTGRSRCRFDSPRLRLPGDGAPARPRSPRRSPRPALPRRLGPVRLEGGCGRPRPGDLCARPLAPAADPQRRRPRLSPARAEEHLPEPETE